MSTAAFRAVHPSVDLSAICGPGRQRLQTSGGLFEFRTAQLRREQVTLPTRITVPDGSATAEFGELGAALHLRRSGFEVVLSNNGIFVGDRFEGDLEEPSRDGVERVARALVTDGGLQRAFLSLTRSMWVGTLEVATATGTPPPAVVREQLHAVEQTYTSFTRPTATTTVVCDLEEVVSTVTEEIWGWVQTGITTAWDQLQACKADCVNRHPVEGLLDWEGAAALAACLANCALQVFVDIVHKTWALVQTVTKHVIEYVTVCREEIVLTWPPSASEGAQQAQGIPSSVGKLHPDEVTGTTDYTILVSGAVPQDDIKKGFEAALPALRCIGKGAWSTWRISVPDLGIGVDEVPVGLQVCISKECLDTIRKTLTWDNAMTIGTLLGALMAANGAEGAAAAILSALGAEVSSAVSSVGAALGITAGQALAAVVVLLIIIAYQLAAIGAQVAFRRKFLRETFENGVCLRHPLFPLAAVAVVTAPTGVGPILAAQVAVNTPVIVVPR